MKLNEKDFETFARIIDKLELTQKIGGKEMNTIQEYNLRITEDQAHMIMLALDLYTRLSAGQFDNLKNISFEKDKDGINKRPSEETLKKLQKEMFPSLGSYNASYGIHSTALPDKVREAHDIYKVMMYEFNKDKGIMNVYADKVRQASKKLLPLFEKINIPKRSQKKGSGRKGNE